ncbi:MAG: SRPBCC domain-containing protein [bacterium]|nr:SRPBCC domain-containing protein [bacterium]
MQLTFKINKPIDMVFDYLTDMQKFVSVHPVISKIDRLTSNNYLVYETLKFGFIAISFTYSVTIDSNFKERTVVMRATVMKLTKIEMSYKLNTENNSTLIRETILFKSPLPIKILLQNVFRKQHKRLFENIESFVK